ncbi:MAG TPA: hypothetical protein VMS98_03060 [Thermoanaerobaculia bacterium]|nr:hypothetical protein [Thermoanaerobaculia bacterium]
MKPLAFAAVLLAATTSFAGVSQPLGSHFQVLIPGAGSTAGANNTFFRSDITIVNLLPRNQVVRLQWLSQNGTSNLVRFIEIPASSGLRSADFVAEALGTTGLGAIIVSAMTGSTGSVDPTAQLYVSARIWTPQPGTAGTTSQSFPVIPTNTIDTPRAALFAVGGGPSPDNSDNYRVNVGVVNLDPVNSQTFTVFIPTPTPVGQTVTLPPMSMTQVTVGSGNAPSTQVIVQNDTPSGTRSNNWITYQSTVDNITGDAWSELGVPGSAQ